MKKSETHACLVAGVLATAVFLTGCGGGSGGGMGGLGATGAAGAAGATGATGGLTNLSSLLNGGAVLDSNLLGTEGIQVDALTPTDLADLSAAGITGAEGVQLLTRNGEIIGLQSPTGSVFGVPVGGNLPVVNGTTLPALPANVGSALSGLRL